MYGDLLKVWGTNHILVATWTNGIEAQSREHIPGRSLSVVFIAAIAIGVGIVHTVHRLVNPVLGFPRLAAVAIQIDHVLYGLVAVGIVTHVHNLHLTDLVDGKAIVAVIKHGRQGKYRVEHLIKGCLTTHQVDESLWVVEYRPGVMP